MLSLETKTPKEKHVGVKAYLVQDNVPKSIGMRERRLRETRRGKRRQRKRDNKHAEISVII